MLLNTLSALHWSISKCENMHQLDDYEPYVRLRKLNIECGLIGVSAIGYSPPTDLGGAQN